MNDLMTTAVKLPEQALLRTLNLTAIFHPPCDQNGYER